MTTADPMQSAGASESHSRLQHFPISYFSMVMGLAGLSIAWQKAAHVLQADPWIGVAFGGIAGAVFLFQLAVYTLKLLRHPAAVQAEFAHPVKLHFFPTISISLILLSIVAAPHAPRLAEGLFIAGAPIQLLFTLLVLNSWFNRTHYEVAHLNPAWFIPIVGNVLVPIAGAALGYLETSWFFFSIGIVFWIVLFAIIVNRVLFHHPIPERLAPTLFILVAPPAVSFLAYMRLTGSLDASARVLFYFALFMTLFMATQAPRLMRMKFYLSWWAYSFPLAAVTIATWTMREATAHPVLSALGWILIAVLSLVLAGLIVRTVLAVARQEICQPE